MNSILKKIYLLAIVIILLQINYTKLYSQTQGLDSIVHYTKYQIINIHLYWNFDEFSLNGLDIEYLHLKNNFGFSVSGGYYWRNINEYDRLNFFTYGVGGIYKIPLSEGIIWLNPAFGLTSGQRFIMDNNQGINFNSFYVKSSVLMNFEIWNYNIGAMYSHYDAPFKGWYIYAGLGFRINKKVNYIKRIKINGHIYKDSPIVKRDTSIKINRKTDGRKKIAFLIGNNKYKNLPKLGRTPTRDVDAMKDSLEKIGFEVIANYDLKREQMITELELFEYKLKNTKYDLALFYYSGHGFHEKEDYLIPVDAKKKIKSDKIRIEDCFIVNKIIANTLKYAQQSVIIIDACRTIPNIYKSDSYGQSFRLNNEEDIMILFSTDIDKKARTCGNFSCFTDYLLNHITKENITIKQVFDNVKKEMYKNSLHEPKKKGYGLDIKLNQK